jgi:hypothetical protein
LLSSAFMRTGWLGFGRERENQAELAPDSGVAGPKAWLLSAAIIASTATLLGTSDVPHYATTYLFERLAIDGGFVELTRDQPSATFFVTLRADDLGPDGVLSTQEAQVLVNGDVTASDLDDATRPPLLSVKLSSPDNPQESTQSTEAHYTQSQGVRFTGNCENPKTGAACTARFRLDLSRADGGENGGSIRFDWAFDATASGQKTTDEDKDTELGPFDPPWTVEITQQ